MTTNVNIPFILRLLGMGKDRSVIASSICLSIISFYYFFVLCSVLQLRGYSFQHRVTYETIFATHIVTLNIDIFIIILAAILWSYFSIIKVWLKIAFMIFFSIFLILLILNYTMLPVAGVALTLPTIILIMFTDRFRNAAILIHDRMLSINYIAILACSLSSLGIVSLILFISSGTATVIIEKYPYAIYQQLLTILSPLIMAGLVFCLPLKVLLNVLINKSKIGSHSSKIDDIVPDRLTTRRVSLYLSLCIILGVTLTFLPHLSVINPNHERLGVDTLRYQQWLDKFENQTSDPIYYTLKSQGDRPLTIITLLLIKGVTQLNSFQAVEYSPLILVTLLIVVTFFLTREITSDDKVAILAALLSGISFQSLVGIYSGFYANWLALILGYLAFALIVRALKNPSKFAILALALAMTGLLLAHVYTWTIMIAIAFVFLLVLLLLNYYPRKRIILVYLVLSSSIAVDVLKSSWIGYSTGLEADVSIGRSGLGLSQFGDRLKTLADTIQTYYGGGIWQYCNPWTWIVLVNSLQSARFS